MGLKVIGTGFGRTGTDSMREALNQLGFGPCHHMHEVIQNPMPYDHWTGLEDGHAPDWGTLFEGYSSCVDWPSAYYWRELIELYPDAKVLLTWRSAESWWTSFEKTILQFLIEKKDISRFAHRMIGDNVFSGRAADRDHAIAVYEANIAEVKATVPPARLLVYELGSGWGPLGDHLGVDQPDHPYPNRNSVEDFHNK